MHNINLFWVTASFESVSQRLEALGDRYKSVFVDLELGFGYPSVVGEEVQQPVLVVALVDGLGLNGLHHINYLGEVLITRVSDLFGLCVVCPLNSAQEIVVGDIALLIRQLPHEVFQPRNALSFLLVNHLLNLIPLVTDGVVVAREVSEEAGTPRALQKVLVGLPVIDVLLLLQSVVNGTGDTQASIAHKQGKLEHLSIQLDGYPRVHYHLNYLFQQQDGLLPLEIQPIDVAAEQWFVVFGSCEDFDLLSGLRLLHFPYARRIIALLTLLIEFF